MDKPYLLFDAGGTLVFPDFTLISEVAYQFGFQVTVEQLFLAHCKLIHSLDTQTRETGHLSDPFPNGYARTLLKSQLPDSDLLEALVLIIEKRNRSLSLWSSTHPWVPETLKSLSQSGYEMSVISNSDGRVEEILEYLSLRTFFHTVFDSHRLNVSKPDRRIFEIALENLKINPQDALYIGDVYFIDVWGANQAGLGCIHLDPQGFYRDWPGVHLPSITHLPGWLRNDNRSTQRLALNSAQNMSITFDTE
jgi:putative hydrolase of the HAD superfamily